MTSDYKSNAENVKDKLGHSMCAAKWQMSTIHLTNGMTSSCYHPPLHKIDAEKIANNPSALHNTDQKKHERKQMLEGTRPTGCSTCWKMEEQKELSDRHYRSGEPWASIHLDRIMEQKWDADEVPSYVEIDFSNVCNLKCLYCSPQFSSTWAAHSNRYGAYPTSVPHNSPSYFNNGDRKIVPMASNPYVKAFWEWWPDLYPELKHFRMTGGEPIMDKNTYKVFDYILKNPKPDLHLNVTSNFVCDPIMMEEYTAYVKKLCDGDNIEHFMQFVSVDSADADAELVRDGMDDYNTFFQNVSNFLEAIPGKMSVTFIITLNVFSKTLHYLLQDIMTLRQRFSAHEQRVWFDVTVLRDPSFLSMKILSTPDVTSIFDKVDSLIEQNNSEPVHQNSVFKDYEIDKISWAKKWALAGREDNDPSSLSSLRKNRADFYMFMNEHIKRLRDTGRSNKMAQHINQHYNTLISECKSQAINSGYIDPDDATL